MVMPDIETMEMCPYRRACVEETTRLKAKAKARGINPSLVTNLDPGPCNWTGMTFEERNDALDDEDGECAAHRGKHLDLLQKTGGIK